MADLRTGSRRLVPGQIQALYSREAKSMWNLQSLRSFIENVAAS